MVCASRLLCSAHPEGEPLASWSDNDSTDGLASAPTLDGTGVPLRQTLRESDPLIGRRLANKYDVLEVIGRDAPEEISALVGDELLRRQERLLERRRKDAAFRDTGKTLDAFDFEFNKKMNRKLVWELATARFVGEHADALFLGPPGTGKSHLAQAIGLAVIQQGYRVAYREAHVLLE